MTFDHSFRSDIDGTGRYAGALLRVYGSITRRGLVIKTDEAPAARLSTDSVRKLRDALTDYLGDAPKPATPTLAAGDRVQIAEDPTMADGSFVQSAYRGAIGYIKDGPDENGDYRVKLSADGPVWDYNYIGAAYLTKAEEPKPAPLAVGDRVRISARPAGCGLVSVSREFAGRVGKITRVAGGCGCYVVRVSGLGTEGVDPKHLTKVEPKFFEVGDRVRIDDAPQVETGGYVSSLMAGRVGEVVEGTNSSGNVRVTVGGLRQWIGARHLTKVEAPAPFAVGDLVLIGSDPRHYNGVALGRAFMNELATVTEELDSDGEIRVSLENGVAAAYILPSGVTRVERLGEDSPLAAGDRVVFLEAGQYCREPVGKLGTVRARSGVFATITPDTVYGLIRTRVSRLGRLSK